MKILDKTLLTNSEIGYVLNVTRVTVYKWRKNLSSPHPLVAERINKALSVFTKLVDRQQLPLPKDLDKAARKQKLEKLKALVVKFAQ